MNRHQSQIETGLRPIAPQISRGMDAVDVGRGHRAFLADPTVAVGRPSTSGMHDREDHL